MGVWGDENKKSRLLVNIGVRRGYNLKDQGVFQGLVGDGQTESQNLNDAN